MSASTHDKLTFLTAELLRAQRTYPVRVASRRMKQAAADRKIALWEAIIADYVDLLQEERFAAWRRSGKAVPMLAEDAP